MNKAKKLAQKIAEFLFEEECGVLKNLSNSEIQKIRDVQKILITKCSK